MSIFNLEPQQLLRAVLEYKVAVKPSQTVGLAKSSIELLVLSACETAIGAMRN